MPDETPGIETLHVAGEFPPVSTAEWDAAIRKDLKGADYEKKLVWRTEEGIAVRPYYRREDAAWLEGRVSLPAGHTWTAREELTFPASAVRADLLQDAGANAVQELAIALAEGVEQFAEAPRPMEFVFAVGANYFFEIAKLRAARILWAQAAAAFNAPGGVTIHARTTRIDKSVYDVYTNLLRATTEAMSAAIGGCDTLAVEAFGYSPHLAVNVHRVLREEAHLDAVADPAAGSYYIEVLTDALARAAWKLFQEIEGAGGYSAATASGFVEKQLETSRAEKRKAVAYRRRTLVGVNNYPNVKEKLPRAQTPAPLGPEEFRLAEPFERIRERTARHAAKTGRYPEVLLLKRGDVKMRMARANFSFNFFGCAGFDIVESEEYAGSGADLIVLCSSDAEYLEIAREVCAAVKVPVIVAGNPKEQAERLQAAGVQGFIHMGSDAVAVLTEWQDRLSMEVA